MEKNVLLLSMSTFPPVRKINRYPLGCKENAYLLIENPDEVFEGESQLEPITKFLLKSVKGGLNKIVIMATPKTLECKPKGVPVPCNSCVLKKSEYISEGGLNGQMPCEQNCALKDKAKELDPWEGMAPCEFFQRKVLEFAAENNIATEGLVFEIVEIPKPAAMSFYQQVIKAIKGDGAGKINLFMNLQGGDRTAAAQANAVVSLLKNQGVKLCGRYAIDYDETETKHLIKCVDEEYKSYDFLSAMEIFRRYGKGEALLEFLENRRKSGENQGRETESREYDARDKELITVIEDISDAIRLCDMEGFETALAKIGALKEKFGAASASGIQRNGQADGKCEVTEFDLVFDDIWDDYKEILPESGTSKILKQITWCRKKGLLQQALTIIESKMPKEICNKFLGVTYVTNGTELDFDVDKDVSVNRNGSWIRDGQRNIKTYISAVLQDKKMAYKTIENYIVEQWLYYYDTKNQSDVVDFAKNRLNQNVNTADEAKRVIEAKITSGTRVDRYIKHWENNEQRSMRFCYVPTDSNAQRAFNRFMFLHSFLKKQRNETNHGGHSDIRCTAKQMEALIDVYLDYANNLGLQ